MAGCLVAELTIKQQKERLFIFQFNSESQLMSQNKDEPTSPIRPPQAKLQTPTKPSPKDADSTRFSTAASRRVLEEESASSKENKYTGCNCSKSQCLKMYCACFSVGKMCDQTCLCQACKNASDNMERAEAINEVITRDPHAFSRSHAEAEFSECNCNCKKSSCLKKYCDCYRRGKQCGQTCQCYGCHNRQQEEKLERSAPTKLSKLQ